MAKLLIDVEVDEVTEDMSIVSLSHEPTKTSVSGSCMNEDLDDLTESLYEELSELINSCANWLH